MAAKKLDKPRNDARFVLTSASAITLFFFTSLKDPFNAPKLWLTILTGAFLMGHLLSDLLLKKFTDGKKEIRILGFITLTFAIFLFLAALVTKMHYVAFFGESQRNTGFLTYFFFSIFLLSAAKHIRSSNGFLVYIFAIATLSLMAIYGLMQHFGQDFVKWNNPYNAIISTVGNPDFAAGIMAVFLVLVFSSLFVTKWSLPIKIPIFIFGLVSLQLIRWSQARQGLLSFGIGFGLFLVIYFWQKKRALGIILTSGFIGVFIFGLLGIFQVGPLTQYLYKSSVTVRGYYWRAGLKMFYENPLFGVGLDRYGSFFREYREIGYPATHGFDLTSTAAHNVPIQIFATGGLFVGFSYLALLGYIVFRAIVGMRNSVGKDRLLLAGVFCAWVTYEAQSIVSIDNIGIAIWGWVLGGAVIGISLLDAIPKSNLSDPKLIKNQKSEVKSLSSITIATPIISTILVLAAFLIVTTQIRAESQMFNINRYAIPTDAQNRNAYHPLIRKVVDIPWMSPMYKLELGSKLAQAGFIDEGFTEIDKIIYSDQKSYIAISTEASFYEQLRKYEKAIPLREKLIKLDPWGARNLLQLGNDYLAVGDKDNARKAWKKILIIEEELKRSFSKTLNADFEATISAAKSQLGA